MMNVAEFPLQNVDYCKDLEPFEQVRADLRINRLTEFGVVPWTCCASRTVPVFLYPSIVYFRLVPNQISEVNERKVRRQ